MPSSQGLVVWSCWDEHSSMVNRSQGGLVRSLGSFISLRLLLACLLLPPEAPAVLLGISEVCTRVFSTVKLYWENRKQAHYFPQPLVCNLASPLASEWQHLAQLVSCLNTHSLSGPTCLVSSWDTSLLHRANSRAELPQHRLDVVSHLCMLSWQKQAESYHTSLQNQYFLH